MAAAALPALRGALVGMEPEVIRLSYCKNVCKKAVSNPQATPRTLLEGAKVGMKPAQRPFVAQSSASFLGPEFARHGQGEH